jgi:ABC-type branched-subunit amino acid transport system substrate-binding protein
VDKLLVPADDVLPVAVDRRAFLAWTARTSIAGLSLVGAWGVAGCTSPGDRAAPRSDKLPSDLKVGVIAPMDGLGQFVGDVVDRSMRAAQAHIEHERLFTGTRVGYDIVNARAEELTAATARAYAKLVADPAVVGVLWCTPVGLKEARAEIRRDGMPVISVFQDLWSEDLIYPRSPERSIFQYIQPDRLGFDVLMEYAQSDRGYKSAGLLYDNTLGDQPKRNFEQALAAHGMEAAGIEQFKLFTADFGAQLQRLKQRGGECLFIWGAADTSASIVKHLDELGAAYVDTPTARRSGWHPQLLGWAGGLGEKKWVELAGSSAKAGTLTTWNLGGLVALPTFPIRDWTRRYLGRMPTGGEEAPANCYWALLQAVKRAGSTDRAAVVHALEGLRTTFAGLEFGFAGNDHLAITRDEIVTVTMERSRGPVVTDPPYVLGREFTDVWIPAYGEYDGPTHLVRPTLQANRRAFPDTIDRILAEGWGTMCTVHPADRHDTGMQLTNECKIH